jgi:predicted  nucleic acid-binding Zn-ribbon protein
MNPDKIRDVIIGNVNDLVAEIETKNDIIDELTQAIRELENKIEEKDDEIQKLKVEIQVFTFLENVK